MPDVGGSPLGRHQVKYPPHCESVRSHLVYITLTLAHHPQLLLPHLVQLQHHLQPGLIVQAGLRHVHLTTARLQEVPVVSH